MNTSLTTRTPNTKCRRPEIFSKGFTLVEMLITVAILAIIGSAFYTIFQGSMLSSRKGMNLAVVYSNLRAAMDYIIKDLKNAVDPASSGRTDMFFIGGEYNLSEGGEYPYSYMEFVIPEENGGYKAVIYAHYKETDATKNRNVLYRVLQNLDSFSITNPRFTYDVTWGNNELALHINKVKFYFGDGENRLISWGYSSPPSSFVRIDSNDKESNRYRLPVYVNIKLTSVYGAESLKQQKEAVLEDTVYLRK